MGCSCGKDICVVEEKNIQNKVIIPKKDLENPKKELEIPKKDFEEPKKDLEIPKEDLEEPKKNLKDPVKDLKDTKKYLKDQTDPILHKSMKYIIKQMETCICKIITSNTYGT